MKFYYTLIFLIAVTLTSCIVKDTYYISKLKEYDIPIDKSKHYINVREYDSSIQLVSWYITNSISKKIEKQEFEILFENLGNIQSYSVKCSGDKAIPLIDTIYTKGKFEFLPNEVKYTLINNNSNKFFYNFRKFKKVKIIKVIINSKLESESLKVDTMLLKRKISYYFSIH
jgi:hypothetical protein